MERAPLTTSRFSVLAYRGEKKERANAEKKEKRIVEIKKEVGYCRKKGKGGDGEIKKGSCRKDGRSPKRERKLSNARQMAIAEKKGKGANVRNILTREIFEITIRN